MKLIETYYQGRHRTLNFNRFDSIEIEGNEIVVKRYNNEVLEYFPIYENEDKEFIEQMYDKIVVLLCDRTYVSVSQVESILKYKIKEKRKLK